MLDLKGLELTVVRNRLLQQRPQPGSIPIVVPQIVERNTLRFLTRDLEHRVEGPIGRLHPQVGVEDHQGSDHRVEDRLRVLAFVNCLLHTGTESGHVREREHGAPDLAIASCVRGYPKEEPPVPVPDFAPEWCPVGNHLNAHLLEIDHVCEHSDVARGPADVRWREAEHCCRPPVEAGHSEVAANRDYGKIDSVEDADEVGADRVRTRSVAMRPADITRPVILCPQSCRHLPGSPEAAYRVRLRCSTASATSGRT